MTETTMDSRDIASGRKDGPGRLVRTLVWLALAGALVEMGFRGPWRAAANSDDFALYYCCARAWIQGENPYDRQALEAVARQAGGAPTQYLGNAVSPPVSFVVLGPLAAVSWPVAKGVWLTLNLGLLAAMCIWLVRMGRMRPGEPRAILLLALIVALAPLHTGIKHGQLALAAAACLIGAARMHQQRRRWLGGVGLGLALALKPQMAAIFVLYWLYRKRWRALAVAGVFIAVLAAITLARLHLADVDWLGQWQQNIQRCFHGGECDYASGPRPFIFIQLQHPLYAIFGSRSVAAVGAWAVTAALAVLGWLAWRRLPAGDDRELAGLSFLAVLSLLPIYHVFYDAVILALPLCWAVRLTATPLRRWGIAIIGLVLPFLLSGAAALAVFSGSGGPLAPYAQTWWFRTLLLPHQPYLLAALAVVMVAALYRAAAEANRIPRETRAVR